MKINIHEIGEIISYDCYSIKYNSGCVNLLIYNNYTDMEIIKIITYPYNRIEKIFENKSNGIADVYLID